MLALLKLIQGFCCSFDTKTQGMMATVEAHKRAYLYFQKDGIDNQTYHREFMAHIETIETYGGFGAIGVVPSILETTLKAMEAEGTIADADNPTQADLKKATEKFREEYLAALFLSGANSARYESLREHLSNLYAMGDDKYPKTVVACLAMLDRYSNKATARGRPHRAQFARANPFHHATIIGPGMDLGADLADPLMAVDRVTHREGLVRVKGHGLLQVNVLACGGGVDGHERMPMRRTGDDHGVDVLPGQQVPVVVVAFGRRLVFRQNLFPARTGHVANSGDHHIRMLGAILQVGAPHAVDADDPKIDALTGSGGAVRAEGGRRGNDRESQRGSCRCLEELAPG